MVVVAVGLNVVVAVCVTVLVVRPDAGRTIDSRGPDTLTVTVGRCAAGSMAAVWVRMTVSVDALGDGATCGVAAPPLTSDPAMNAPTVHRHPDAPAMVARRRRDRWSRTFASRRRSEGTPGASLASAAT